MNAFTTPDTTVYAFASQHPDDYHNLMSVRIRRDALIVVYIQKPVYCNFYIS